MRKQIALSALAMAVCLFAGASSYGMKKVAQSRMQFLKLPVGARTVGMGEAFVAIAGDPNNVFYNPAGTAFVNGLSMTFNQATWIAGISHQAAALSYTAGRFGTFTVSYISMNYGEFERTEVDAHSWEGYVSRGTFTVGEYAVGLAYAHQITDRFFVGGQVKYAFQDLGNSRVWEYIGTEFERELERENKDEVVAYDFGTYYNAGFKNLRIAMSVQNFANRPIPLTFRFGMALDASQFLVGENSPHTLTIAIDGIHPRDYSERMHLGAEYWYAHVLALRVGYKLNYDLGQLNWGFGFRTHLMGIGFRFDYAVSDMDVFGYKQRFSVGISL